MAPERVQLRRSKGWRKPAGVVVVSRPSRWGNPFRFGVDGDRRQCVELYRSALLEGGLAFTIEEAREALGGLDLACWCPLVDAEGRPVPCHANVLLELTNS